MAVHDMTTEAKAATQVDAVASSDRADLLGIAFLTIIGIAMMAWVGGLIWLALMAVNWLAS